MRKWKLLILCLLALCCWGALAEEPEEGLALIDGIPPHDGVHFRMCGCSWHVIGEDEHSWLAISDVLAYEHMAYESLFRFYLGSRQLYRLIDGPEHGALRPLMRHFEGFRCYANLELLLSILSKEEAELYLPEPEDRLPGRWWLSTYPGTCSDSPPDRYDRQATQYCVSEYGDIGPSIVIIDHGVRPVCVVELDRILFVNAVNGKPEPGTGFVPFHALGADEDRRVTVHLAKRDGFFATLLGDTVGRLGKLTVSYIGASAEANDLISVMICDANGTILYYASAAPDTSGSGECEFSLPEQLPLGNYVVKVFNEMRIDGDHFDGASRMVSCPLTVVAVPGLEGSGTAANPCQIDSEEDWDALAAALEGGVNTGGLFFQLTNDISVSAMVGTQENPFSGTFDGGGKTLTFSAVNPDNDTRVAPFAYAGGATIHGLHTAGSITGYYDRVSGMIGENSGNTLVKNCRVSMSLSGKSFVGAFCIGDGGGLTLEGCVFDGSISAGNRNGGFVGWTEGNLAIRDCLFIPGSASGTSDCSTFYYNSYSTDTAAVTNSYWRTAFGASQGIRAFSITAGRGVTVDFGVPDTAYDVSGIMAWPTGLLYNGLYCTDAGETVAIGLTAETWDEHTTTYTASTGTLAEKDAGWALTMSAKDSVITARRTPTFATVPVIQLASNGGSNGYKNEGPQNLYDGLDDTKWCCPFNGQNWTAFHTPVPVVPTAYALKTGGDTALVPGRNPVSWKLSGRMNTEDSWTELTTQTNNDHLPPENCAEVFFPLHVSGSYQYYKLEITAIGSGATLQLSEISLVGTPAFGTAAFTLPAAVTTIAESAFEGVTDMISVDAGNCTSIGSRAFADCAALNRIRLPGNCDIYADAFIGCGTVYVFAPAGGSTEAYCIAHENCVFVE